VAVDRGLSGPRLRKVYQLLLGAYGRQHWWPAKSRFEVMVGAVLTQNAAWSNVERAIANLRAADWLRPHPIAAAAPAALAELIRPAGYFNVKARRLQSFCRFLLEQGGEGALAARPTAELRAQLLRVHGVGPETADDMLLYAFERPVFVIDAYTRRIFARLGLIAGDEGYEGLRADFEAALGPDAPLYNEYHALIVRHAKEACRKRPGCGGCRLQGLCPQGQAENALASDVG
jgi:endonuclease-3 related protein